MADTHSWIWWLQRSRRLSPAVRSLFETTEIIAIPAIVCWEVAMLAARDRIQVGDVSVFLNHALGLPRTRLEPLTAAVAVRAAALDWPHRDPADRLIVATALELGAPLATRDERITASAIPGLLTVW